MELYLYFCPFKNICLGLFFLIFVIAFLIGTDNSNLSDNGNNNNNDDSNNNNNVLNNNNSNNNSNYYSSNNNK